MTIRKYPLMDETPGAAGGGTPPAIAWLPQADADTVGFVQNKAWQGPGDAITGYRNLEKLLGADRAGRTVVIPADANDAAGFEAMYTKLGRPGNADAYQLPVPQGASPDFGKSAAAWFHKAGLNTAQAQTIAGAWNEYHTQQAAQEQQTLAAALTAEHAQLEVDWGKKETPAYNLQKELARRGMTAMGFDEKTVDALESVAGFAAVMKGFAKYGKSLAEHSAEGLNTGSSGFAMTPEQAKVRKAELIADKDWGKRAMVPKSKEWNEMERLNQVIAASLG